MTLLFTVSGSMREAAVFSRLSLELNEPLRCPGPSERCPREDMVIDEIIFPAALLAQFRRRACAWSEKSNRKGEAVCQKSHHGPGDNVQHASRL